MKVFSEIGVAAGHWRRQEGVGGSFAVENGGHRGRRLFPWFQIGHSYYSNGGIGGGGFFFVARPGLSRVGNLITYIDKIRSTY